jgi:hypothetical protein
MSNAESIRVQTGMKYKAHYGYNAKFRALKPNLLFVKRDDERGLKEMNERWKALNC